VNPDCAAHLGRRSTLGRVADAEVGRRARVEAALTEEPPRGIRLRGGELTAEPLRRRGVRLIEAGAPARLGRRSPSS
jgi:hypothetical protein